MDTRREALLKRKRRRRVRLMTLCVATALVCGAVVATVTPRALIGEEATSQRPATTAAPEPVPVSAEGEALLLRLAERFDVDPREVRSSTQRWASMSESERRRFFETYWRIVELDPEEKEALFQQYAAFRSRDHNRREHLRRRARQLREFVEGLSLQDQAVFEGMTPEQRAKRLLESWGKRYGE